MAAKLRPTNSGLAMAARAMALSPRGGAAATVSLSTCWADILFRLEVVVKVEEEEEEEEEEDKEEKKEEVLRTEVRVLI